MMVKIINLEQCLWKNCYEQELKTASEETALKNYQLCMRCLGYGYVATNPDAMPKDEDYGEHRCEFYVSYRTLIFG
jgi:hypothetical protein